MSHFKFGKSFWRHIAFLGLLFSAVAAGLQALAARQAMAAIEWQTTAGGNTGDPTLGTSWIGGVAPGTADEARFTNLAGVPTTVNVATNWGVKYIGFSATGFVGADGSLGVIPDYTFTGAGKITISSNANIDTGWGQTGTVTFNNTGGIDLTRGAALYGASVPGGTSNLVIGVNTPLRMGVGGSSGTPAIHAWGSDVTVNSANGVDFSGATTNRAMTLDAQAGRTITLTNGVVTTTRLTSINVTGQTGGKVILGASPTPTWAGNVGINNSDLVIVSNNSLGAVGNLTTVSGYTEPNGGANTGALVLSNSVVPTGINSGEAIFLGPRTTDNFAQLKNLSGHNILSGNIGADGTNAPGQTDQNYVLEAQGTVGVDIFELSGTIQKTTFASGAGTLTLRGSGSGLVSGVISGTPVASNTGVQDGGTWGVTKKDSGTWTLTNANTYVGPTSIQQGTLALSGSGSIANSPSIAVKSGAFLDVTGLSGSNLTLGSSQTLTGAGTVTGNLTAVAGTILAPGDNGPGTLHVTAGLGVTDSTLQFQLTNNTAATNDHIIAGGALNAAGVNTIAVTMTNGVLGAGTYHLIDYVGAPVNLANFNLTGVTLSARQTSATLSTVANQLNLDVVGGPATLTWLGGNNADAWDVGVTVNWTGAADNHFFDGDSVIFGTTSNTNTPVIAGTVAPGQATFNSTGQSYTLSGGTMAVAGDLIVSATGNVTLTNAATTVGGNFAKSGAGNLSVTAGNFTVSGTFTHGGSGTTTFSNSGGLLSLPSIIALNSGTLAISRSDDLTGAGAFSKALTGAGTFQKGGVNIVEVTGNNSGFTGQMVVTSGTLKTIGNNSLGAGGTLASGVVVSDGATLDIINGTTATGTGTEVVAISGNGADGRGALTVTQATNSNGHVNQIILNADSKIGAYGTGVDSSGRSILWVDGAGAAIQGNNHNLSVVIDVGGNAANGTEVDWLNVGDTNLNNIDVSGGGVLYIGGNTTLGSTSGSLTLEDNGRLGFYGSQVANASTGLINKPIVVANTANGGGIEVYYGNMSIASPITMNGNLNFDVYGRVNNTTATTTLSGQISGSGNLAVHANSTASSRKGMIVLTANNTYTGTTTIGGGGGYSGVAAASDRITLSVGDGGTTGSLGTGDVINNWILQFNHSNDITVNNNISGAGGDLYQVGTGTTTLTSANTYGGITRVDHGTLKITGSHTGGYYYDVAGNVGLDGNVILDGGPSGVITLTHALYVGTTSGIGSFTQKDGSVTVGDAGTEDTIVPELYVGYDASGNGHYDLQGGTLTVNGWTNIGRDSGLGVFDNSATFITTRELRVGANYNQTGGDGIFNNIGTAVTQAGDLVIAAGGTFGSTGHYNQLGAGTTTVTNAVYVGDHGTGFFNMGDGTLTAGGGLIIANWNNGDGTYAQGTYTQTGGTASFGGDIIVGWDAGTTGVMNLSGAGSSVHTTGSMFVGLDGTGGTFNLSGGTIAIDGFTSTARSIGSAGVSNISGGALTVSGDYNVGDYGTGTLNQTGGSITTNGWFVVGYNTESTGNIATINGAGATVISTSDNADAPQVMVGLNGAGTLNLMNGSISVTGNGDIRVGDNTTGNGTLNQTGGSIVGNDWTYIGRSGVGTYNLDGGTFSTDDNFSIGLNSTGLGQMTQTGGTVTVLGNQPSPSASGFGTGNLIVGRTGSGTLNISGGVINLQVGTVSPTDGTFNSASASVAMNTGGLGHELDHAKDGNIYVAERSGSGTLNLSGAGVINAGANVFVGGFDGTTFAGGTGTLTVSGGALHVGVSSPTGGDLVLGSPVSSSATVNLQGGLLDVSHGSGIIGSGGAASSKTFSFTGGTLKVKEWNPNIVGGDLGALVQNGATSVLDASGNSTILHGGYTLSAGKVIAAHTVAVTGGDLSVASGAQYVWQLGALSTSNPGTDFGQITADGNIALGDGVNPNPTLAVNLALLSAGQLPGAGNVFWDSNHSWTVLDGMSAATFTGNFTLANTSGPGPWSLSLGTGAEAGDVILNYTLLAGDVNGDGFVNQLDLNVVSGHWQAGPGSTLAQGDANGDGFVNQLDLNVISGHWQAVASGFALTSYSTAPVVAAVPEPGSFILLGGVSLLALAGYRRRLARSNA